VELAVVIGKKTKDVPQSKVMDHIAGYTIALDMTARNQQDQAKKAGLPWTQSKGYDTFCPIGRFLPKERIPNPSNVDIWLKVNNQVRQKGNTSNMIFSVERLISDISYVITLEPGDLVLTGTPEGVGKVEHGDIITAGIGIPNSTISLLEIKFPVKDRIVSKL